MEQDLELTDEPIVNSNANIVEEAVYNAEDPYIMEAEQNQAAIDREKERMETREEADPSRLTPEGQRSVENPEGDPEKNKNAGKPFGYTDTRTNQDTGEEEKVERSYSDNDAVRAIQQAGDAAMDNPIIGIPASMGAGVVDTVTDVIGLVPGLQFIDEAYDENFGRERSMNALTGATRDISAIVIPSLIGGAGIWAKGAQAISKAGKVGKALSAKKHMMTLGRIATDMGVSTSVAAVSEQTSERGNASSAISTLFGIQTPWDTAHIDDPDVRYQLNMTEEIALGSFGSVLDGFFSMTGLGAKIFAKKGDKAAEEAILKVESKYAKVLAKADGDDLTAAVDGKIAARKAAQDEEAIRRYQESVNLDKPEPAKYDAFINEPAEPQARVVMNYDAEPINFMTDIARIADPIKGKTVNGRARPAVTDNFKVNLMDANTGKRAELLSEVAGELRINFSTQVGDNTIPAEEMQKAVEAFAAAAQNQAPGEFKKTVESLMGRTDTILGNNIKALSRDGFNLATAAFRKAFDKLDPEILKASGVVAGQSGTDVMDLARATKLGGEYMDTTRQQELLFNNLKTLLPEIRASQYLDGWALNADKFSKAVSNGDDLSSFATWMDESGKGFEVTIKREKEKALEFINTLKDVSEKNPEYFKPLINEYAKSGDVDTVYKLTKKMEQKIGFWKKAFVDGQPEVPSLLVKQLQAVRYNNVLSGLAPVRALGGAAMAIVGKPLTVLAGSGFRRDGDAFKRALYAFSGIQENFNRGLQAMRREWHEAVTNPEALGARGARADLNIATLLKEHEQLDDMQAAWYKNGEYGKVAVWNMTKVLSAINNNPIVRFGINSMTAIDGFTKSFNASMHARAMAYDTMFSKSKGAIDQVEFDKVQRELYNAQFTPDGVLKEDSPAFYSAGEMNLNLPSETVSSLEQVFKRAPMLKTIFMFARTGINSLGVIATFSPLTPLGITAGKVRRAFKAKTTDQIEAVLSEHNLQGQGMEAFNALKSEYRGRQLMGSAVTLGAATLAFNGGLTGSGPQDLGEKRRMINNGTFKPFSIKNPLTGEWHSYQGLEPFDTYLGLVADIVYQGTRVDQAVSEDFLRAASAAISYNITNKTFLSGFDPLVGMISGDPHEWNRFFAMNADSLIPGTGMRSILSKAIQPQLKDVENNWLAHLANRNRWLPPINAELTDMLDVYTGKPINSASPWNSWVNSLLPFFKTNEGMEDWRQKLAASGWDGLQTPRVHPNSGEPLKPAERQWINNWIAQNSRLGESVAKLFDRPDSFWEKEMKKYAKTRGLSSQAAFPIKETVLHRLLDELHNNAFNDAYAALNQQYDTESNKTVLQQGIKAALNSGQTEKAGTIRDNLIKYGQN